MLVQRSKRNVLATTKIAFIAGAIPSSTGGDILSVEVGVGNQLVRQYATGISLINSLEYCAVIDISGSLTGASFKMMRQTTG